MCTHTIFFLHSDTLFIVSSFHSFSFIFPMTASIDLTLCIYSTVPCVVILLFNTVSSSYATLGSKIICFCWAPLFGKLCKWRSSSVVHAGDVLPSGELCCFLILHHAIITFLNCRSSRHTIGCMCVGLGSFCRGKIGWQFSI